MANVHPFAAYRYSAGSGPLEKLLTQPYDKISPAMQRQYYANHQKNIVRIILGEKQQSDTDTDNPYTRAGAFFSEWIQDGTLVQDPAPGFYVYFQEFEVPDSDGQRATRKGFIGLGDVVDYSEDVVFRHELTFPGPKKDRRQVLEATHAHFGQIFMLYPDREGTVDKLLEETAAGPPLASMVDEYGVRHSIWKMTQPGKIEAIQQAMRLKQLIIADGHHRYETALAFSRDHPEVPGASRAMMTFVNIYSPGLKILPTHRVLRDVEDFEPEALREDLERDFKITRFPSLFEMQKQWSRPHPLSVQIGAIFAGDGHAYLLEIRRRQDDLDVRVLHDLILLERFGIGPEAVREGAEVTYVRGVEPAAHMVKHEGYQVAFLLEPPSIEQVAEISLAGGVMPQKSTDFYPKLLTGLVIDKLEK